MCCTFMQQRWTGTSYSTDSTTQVNLLMEHAISYLCYMQSLQGFSVIRYEENAVEVLNSTDLIWELEALAPVDNLAAGGHGVV